MLKGITARKLYRQRPLPHPHPLLSPLTLQCFPYVLELGVNRGADLAIALRFSSIPKLPFNSNYDKKTPFTFVPCGEPLRSWSCEAGVGIVFRKLLKKV